MPLSPLLTAPPGSSSLPASLFRGAFEALPDHAAILDDRGVILETNHSWDRFASESNGGVLLAASPATSYFTVCDAAAHAGVAEATGIAAGLRQVGRGTTDTFEAEYHCSIAGLARWFLLRATSFSDGSERRILVTHVDITARRESERLVRESEAQYRLLFEGNPAPMWMVDRDTLHCLAVNDAAIRHYGFTREEFMAMSAFDLRVPEEHDALRARVAAPAGQKERVVCTRHRLKNGSVIDVEVIAHRLGSTDSQRVIVLATDVTERRRVERERQLLVRSLEFERNRLAAMFQQAPAFIVTLRGPEYVFELANDAYYQLVGFRDLIGRPVAEALPEIVSQGFVELLDTVMRTGEPFVANRMPVDLQRTPGGPVERRIVDFVYQPMDEADGTVSGVFAHGVDVTEQVRAAQIVEESERRYRTLVELSPDGIVMHTGARILFANSAAARIMGFDSPEQMVGLNALEFIHPDARGAMLERMAQLDDGSPTTPMEQRWIGRDGAVRHLEVSSMPLKIGDRAAVQTVFRDTHQRRQLEEQLRQSQKMEAVGRLAGGIAHDFNNLLTVIRANVEFLLEDLEQSDPRRRDASEIGTAAERAASLTRQLLAFSRKQILQPRVLDLNTVVENLKPMVARLIGEDIVVATELATPLGAVMADPGQIEQVLMNLVVNSRDAMPNGGRITISTSTARLDSEAESSERGAVARGDYVLLAVSDTGSGILAELRPRIFEPFFTTKPTGQGTGLGLSTVYGIVKQSGGHVWVTSEEKVGTTFRIYLPLLEESPSDTGEHRIARGSHRGSETILLVEDEGSVRAIARRVLARNGYIVLEAENGREALEIAAAHDGVIDLVLTDVVMPEMSGGELSERLVSERPGVRIMFMSGYTDGDVIRRGVLGGAAFIQKPFRPDQLLETVRETLDASLPGTER